MENSILQCQICYLDYDSQERAPRVIPPCGHSICTICIQDILNHERGQYFQCPFDKKRMQLQRKDASIFPKNFALLGIIENKPEEGVLNACKKHNKLLRYICLQHREKVCADCANLPEHTDHQIFVITDLKQKIQQGVIAVEETIKFIENDYKYPTRKIDQALQEKEKELLRQVEVKFDVYFKILQQAKKKIELDIQQRTNDARFMMLSKYNSSIPEDQEKEMMKELMIWRGQAKQLIQNWKLEQSITKSSNEMITPGDYTILEKDLGSIRERRVHWINKRKDNWKLLKILQDVEDIKINFESEDKIICDFPSYKISNFENLESHFPDEVIAEKLEESREKLELNSMLNAKSPGNEAPSVIMAKEDRKYLELDMKESQIQFNWQGDCLTLVNDEKSKIVGLFNSVIKFATANKERPDKYQHIKNLTIKFNDFTDKIFDKFNKTLEKLRNLQFLHLEFTNNNKITFASMESFSKAISKLIHLENLIVDQRNCSEIGGDSIARIMDSIAHLPSLTILKFLCPEPGHTSGAFFNNMTEIMSTSFSDIPELNKLTLWLPPNKFLLDSDLIKLFKSFHNMKKLTELDIGFKSFQAVTDKGTSDILDYLLNLLHLNKLMIRFDVKSEKNIIDLARSIPDLYNLSYFGLCLTECKSITANAFKALGTSLSELIHLNGLELVICNYNGDRAYVLGDYISKIKNLKTLILKFWNCLSQIDNNISKIFNNMMILKKIEEFTFMHPLSTNTEFVAIRNFATLQPRLKTLSVELALISDDLDDENLKRYFLIIGKENPQLKKFVLKIQRAICITDSGISKCEDFLDLAKNLETFSFGLSNSMVTDAGIIAVIRALMNIERIFKINLEFTECSSIYNPETKSKLVSYFKLENERGEKDPANNLILT